MRTFLVKFWPSAWPWAARTAPGRTRARPKAKIFKKKCSARGFGEPGSPGTTPNPKMGRRAARRKKNWVAENVRKTSENVRKRPKNVRKRSKTIPETSKNIRTKRSGCIDTNWRRHSHTGEIPNQSQPKLRCHDLTKHSLERLSLSQNGYS